MTRLPSFPMVRSGLNDLVGDMRADLARGITPETAINTLRTTIPMLFDKQETVLMLAVSIVELAQQKA